MHRIKYIFLLIVGTTFLLNAQLSKRDLELIDSVQKIILKQKNDTAIIYYECIKNEYIYGKEPGRSLKTIPPLLEKAKRINHANSILRVYSAYEFSLWRMAEQENDLNKKEYYLQRADSVCTAHLKYCMQSFTGKQFVVAASQPIGRWRRLSELSIKRKDEYFQKEIGGYNMLINKYQLRIYPEQFIKIMFGMAVSYQNRLKTAEAVNCYLVLTHYCDSIKKFDEAAGFYNNVGFAYFADGNYVAAQKYYFYSLKAIENIPADSFKMGPLYKARLDDHGVILSNIANIFGLQKNYEQSIDYFKRALFCFKLSGNTDRYILLTYRIGTNFANAGKIDSAQAYIRKYKQFAHTIKDTTKLKRYEFRSNLLSALIESKKKNYQYAVSFAINAVKIAEDTKDVGMILESYTALGGYLVLNDQPAKALEYYNKELSYQNNAGAWKEKTFSKLYVDKGKAFLKLNKPDSAISNLLVAKTLAEKVNVKQEMNFVYQALADAYSAAKQPDNAIFYLRKHIQYKDSLIGDQVTQQITSTSLKYENDLKSMKEKSIREKQQLENVRKEEEQAQQKNVLMTIILSVSLLVIVACFSLLRSKRSNAMLKEQKAEIEEKNKEITDSINYAKRIQNALLAGKQLMDENLKDYFIIYKPKSIVSGDFYWAVKTTNERGEENFILVTADSTGHGVPGAIMSILNIACLDKTITEGITSPDLILNETRSLIIDHLKNDGSADGGKDGMDASLLSFDFKNSMLNFASANNPVWIIRKGKLIEIKGDRFPVGKHDMDNTEFTLHTIDMEKGDIIYTLTDGFADQFGGPNGKKFKHKLLQELLLSIKQDSMEVQKQKLLEAFDNWKGNVEQIDDVCIIGIKV